MENSAPASVPLKLLIVELDGVLVDVHREVHLAGFNAAFKALDLDCAHWSPEIYTDLVAEGGGTAQGMIAAYFGKVGWPIFLPKEERGIYGEKIEALKDAAIPELVRSGKVALRAGALEFLTQAVQSEDFKVAVISATASDPADKIAEAVLACLGEEALAEILVFGSSGILSDMEGGVQEVPLESQLANFLDQRKREAVAEIGEAMFTNQGSTQLAVDSSVLGIRSQRATITTDLLQTITMLSGVPVSSAAFVTCSSNSVPTASTAGLMCFAVKNSLLTRGAQYSGTLSVFDGFGPGGGATISRIRALMDSSLNSKTVPGNF